ncbi:potassium channel family protein [Apilactobacillus bombintestini]|uniref:Ion transporter n=1 Tax=Apilactobacillus bombintestini TaxID=2419772 RepID=A0A387AQG8_9LACO|nr:potassium channel family protein [Apilactobacillus bombintestini]AYF93022.1 ion transporter [Apilactobacillus bombintestini]
MRSFKNPHVELIYDIFIVFIAIFSVALVGLDYLHVINIYHGGLALAYYSIWIFYIIDYIVGLALAKNHKRFLLETSLDLISLIPAHPIFVVFRLYRVIRIIRYYNLFWKFGWDGRFTGGLHRFIYDTGFIYLFSISIVILIFSALIYSHFEQHNLSTSLWWAITTATTVGYGDISPQTVGGKLIAGFLMFGGIGFIGLLTSTITDFFTHGENDATDDKIDKLTEQIELLTKEVHSLQKEVHKKSTPKKGAKKK